MHRWVGGCVGPHQLIVVQGMEPRSVLPALSPWVKKALAPCAHWHRGGTVDGCLERPCEGGGSGNRVYGEHVAPDALLTERNRAWHVAPVHLDRQTGRRMFPATGQHCHPQILACALPIYIFPKQQA